MNPGRHLPLALLLAVVVRVPFWAEALRTPLDGDTAIIGLMSRHLGRGTTMWGQPYGSPLDAWLAAPFVAALGTTTAALRLLYFLLGLGLVPVAYFLARSLHARAALPAAVLMACPPPYFLLLAALPPPFYPTTLILCGVLLIVALRLAGRLASGDRPLAGLALWGLLAGLALWTHLMSASVVVPAAALLLARARGRGALQAAVLLGLLTASAPWWTRAIGERGAGGVSLADRDETLGGHLAEVLPALHRPVGGLLGTHVPVVADVGHPLVLAPTWAAFALVLVYGLSLVQAVGQCRRSTGARLLLAAAALALLAFPFPLRSGPNTIRFLTPAYISVLSLVVWAPLAGTGQDPGAGRRGVRRAWLVVLALASLHLVTGSRLLASWRETDRAGPPFFLPDLAEARAWLDARRIRRAYASYGPAYRLSYESGERIVVSQPWNERFRHYPLPYLDEVRFAKQVAWLLTPDVPTDLPAPRAFEDLLGQAAGSWKRASVGPAILYHDFVPPFGSRVEASPSAGAAGDGDPATRIAAAGAAARTFPLVPPRPLDAVTLLAPRDGVPLLRSMNVEVASEDGAFETVARRRRREERRELRWVNGHPQFVIDHDLIAVPLGGRRVAALRISPYASDEPWQLAEILLHPAEDPERREPWDEWLDPNLDWDARRRALAARPRRDREDWHYRSLLAGRNH